MCHSCGTTVSSDKSKCHMCNTQRPGDTDWICNICTFVNEESAEVCQMCLGERPHILGKKKMNEKDNNSMNNKTWTCPACDYHNTKTKLCRMCGYELGNKVTRQNGGSSSISKQNGHNEAVQLQEANGSKNKPMVDVASANTTQENLQNYSDPKSPSKVADVDGNSGDYDVDPFPEIAGWENPVSPPDGM